MTDIHDMDGHIVEAHAGGGIYSLVTFTEDGPRVMKIGDRDAALKFAYDLLIAGLDAMDKDD